MTNEEIRIKVATALGLTVCDGCRNMIDPDCCSCGSPMAGHSQWDGHSPVPMGCRCGYHEQPQPAWGGVPNYPESLDACAEFEETLTDAEWDAYSAEIVSLTLWDRATDTVKRILQATARQRCLAYLRVKGILP